MGILGGAVIGATAGGVLGGLAGMGIPEEEAQYYSSEFQAGRHLVTVRANRGYDEAREILSRRGAYDIQTRGEPKPAVPVTDVDSGGAATTQAAGSAGSWREWSSTSYLLSWPGAFLETERGAFRISCSYRAAGPSGSQTRGRPRGPKLACPSIPFREVS